MTLTDHDPSELLAATHAGEFTDHIRASSQWILQLIEAEDWHPYVSVPARPQIG